MPLTRRARPVAGGEYGCVFSPDDRTLFANIQDPGNMPAITRPWRRSPR
jgi:secreted PhoX family phosphatase